MLQAISLASSRSECRRRDHVFFARWFQLLLRLRSNAYETPSDSRGPGSQRNHGDLEISSIHELPHSFAFPFGGAWLFSTVSVKFFMAAFCYGHHL